MRINETEAHPYIPNSAPKVRTEMLREIGVKSIEELLSLIPRNLRLKKRLQLPEPLAAEHELQRHVETLLAKNKSCDDYLNFLGGGCWQHYVPAVCDEIVGRAEFLTAYASDTYTDLGKWQTFFEFQSMMGDLVEMDVVSLPTYDWGSAAGFAIRMASRISGRNEVLIPRNISPERLSIIRNFCQPHGLSNHIRIKLVDYDTETGKLDLTDLRDRLTSRTGVVYFENPSYHGQIESEADEVTRIAHDGGAECIVGVDPISLGVVAPPAQYGADLVCGEIQPLGNHMNYGGGLGGFLASRDEEKYVSHYPLYLVSIAGTNRRGEFGFARSTPERTLYNLREKGMDFTGTTVGLTTIAAAVYLSLIGPTGIRELGKTIIQRSHYAASLLADLENVDLLFSPYFFKEFVIRLTRGKKVLAANKDLLKYKIFGGNDLSRNFPELGQSALFCVTEIHSMAEIQTLATALKEVLK